MYTPTQGQIGTDPNNGVNSQSPGKPCCKPAQLWELRKDTFAAWSKDKVPRHGAARDHRR